MARRMGTGSGLGLLLALVVATPAAAGGWAQVSLDAGTPAGEGGEGGVTGSGGDGTTTIGFTLLQHGTAPVDWGTVSLVAVNDTSGQTIRGQARSDGGGHWVADLALPSGSWTLAVMHEDLEVVATGPMVMSAAGVTAAPSAPAGTPWLAYGIPLAVLVMVAGAGTTLLIALRRGTDAETAVVAARRRSEA